MGRVLELPIGDQDYATLAHILNPGRQLEPPPRDAVTITSAGFAHLVEAYGDPVQRLQEPISRGLRALIWSDVEAWDLGHVRAIYRPHRAKVWLCNDGPHPTPTGQPLVELSLATCIAQLGLARSHFHSDLANPPRFGRAGDPLAEYRGAQHVVVEVGAEEAQRHRLEPGFYQLPITPAEACRALGVQPSPPPARP